MKTEPGLSWVSNNRQNSVKFPSICRICNNAPISSKWPFWFTEMAILKLKKYFLSIATYLKPKKTIFDQQIVFNFFSTHKNGHFRIQKFPFWRNKGMDANSGMKECTYNIWHPWQLWSRLHMESYRPHLLVCTIINCWGPSRELELYDVICQRYTEWTQHKFWETVSKLISTKT